MNAIWSVVNAFRTLRDRGIATPVYARMVLGKGEDKMVGWIYRDRNRTNHDIKSGESFRIIVGNAYGRNAKATVTWEPPFWGNFTNGTDADIRRIRWFLHQGPALRGGSHLSLDNFKGHAADWSLATWDYYMVRCGSYLDANGERFFRQPSEEALDWVQDPKRFKVDAETRKLVLDTMLNRLPDGNWVTIRRIFLTDNDKDE